MKKVITVDDIMNLKQGDTLHIETNTIITPAAWDLISSIGINLEKRQEDDLALDLNDDLSQKDRRVIRNLVMSRLGKEARPEEIETNVRTVLERLQSVKRNQNQNKENVEAKTEKKIRPEYDQKPLRKDLFEFILVISCKDKPDILNSLIEHLVTLPVSIRDISSSSIHGYLFINMFLSSRETDCTLDKTRTSIELWARKTQTQFFIHSCEELTNL